MKRYCQKLSLADDPQLIERYCLEHSRVWPEIKEGIRSVGILDMQIWIRDNQSFMIVDTVDDFDWDRDMDRLSQLPRQAEWEAYMAPLQGAEASAKSTEKWQIMKRIFKLDD